ncbi:hypothetical protein M404DRAFT_29174 [Pisolithus tinctorius Marx 270]|uniref:Uncharacterized protein n=1 Tax=Pisolithus tinctorius Marx 270 TaxID=870435 RepID=A0A0C3JU35_PISTI|nr:hypothetical protein M404DRAFT_29174 [Pisolithus tinctorius Marx 270]
MFQLHSAQQLRALLRTTVILSPPRHRLPARRLYASSLDVLAEPELAPFHSLRAAADFHHHAASGVQDLEEFILPFTPDPLLPTRKVLISFLSWVTVTLPSIAV